MPASTAQFPGSFASDLRQDHRKYAEIRTFRSIIYTYFTDQWDDISVWKSAVSTPPFEEGTSPLQNEMLSFLPVYRVCRNNFTVLRLRYDRRHNKELQYFPSRGLCRHYQYLCPNLVHLRTCSLIWWPHKPNYHIYYDVCWVDWIFSRYPVYDRADSWGCGCWRIDQRKSWITINPYVSGSTPKQS